jgi:hypothetical protein
LRATADHRTTWSATMQHITEGRASCSAATSSTGGAIFPNTTPPHLVKSRNRDSRGGSCIVSPFGEFGGPNFEDETILVAELNRGLLPKAKLILTL